MSLTKLSVTALFLTASLSSIAHGIPVVEVEEDIRVSFLVPLSDARTSTEAGCIASERGFMPGNDTFAPRCLFMDQFFNSITLTGLVGVREFNHRSAKYVAEFGTLGGCSRNISATIYDSSLSPAVAIREMLTMLSSDKPPHFIVGPARSACSTASSLISGVYDIPQISFWSTSTELDNKNEYPSFMRTIPSDDTVAFSICKFWEEQGWDHAAIIYISDSYGEAYKESIVKHCTARSIRVFSFPYSGDSDGIKKQVETMASLQVNIFLLVSVSSGVKEILTEGYNLGIVGEGSQWFFSDGVSSDQFLEIGKENAHILPSLKGSMRVIATGGTSSNPIWNKFEDDWSSMGLEEISDHMPSYVKPPSDFFTQVSASETNIKDVGAYLFDAIAAIGIKACAISPSGALPSNLGKLFLEKKEEIVFDGLTGRIGFNELGNRNTSLANFELSNLDFVTVDNNLKDKFVTKMVYDRISDSWVKFGEEDLVYNGNVAVKPSAVTVSPHDFQQSSTIHTLCLLLCSMNLLTATGFLIWTFLNRMHAVVRASQTKFLALVAVGAMISSSSIIFFSTDDAIIDTEYFNFRNDVAFNATDTDAPGAGFLNSSCTIAVYLFSIGFVISYSSLASKIFRVKKIFGNKSLKKVNISNKQLFSIIAFCAMVDIVIVSLWSAFSPFTYVRTVLARDPLMYPLKSAGRCVSENYLPYVTALGGFHVLLLFVGNYYAFLTRNVHTAFSEGKYVSIAMVSTLQVYALAIPILIIAADNPSSNMFLRSGVIFLSDLSVMCLVFVPKIIAVRSGVGETGTNSLLNTKSAGATTQAVTPTTDGSLR